MTVLGYLSAIAVVALNVAVLDATSYGAPSHGGAKHGGRGRGHYGGRRSGCKTVQVQCGTEPYQRTVPKTCQKEECKVVEVDGTCSRKNCYDVPVPKT